MGSWEQGQRVGICYFAPITIASWCVISLKTARVPLFGIDSAFSRWLAQGGKPSIFWVSVGLIHRCSVTRPSIFYFVFNLCDMYRVYLSIFLISFIPIVFHKLHIEDQTRDGNIWPDSLESFFSASISLSEKFIVNTVAAPSKHCTVKHEYGGCI